MVESCLCFALETGGLIIGWLYFIFYILLAIIFVIALILICLMSCNEFKEQLGQDGVDVCNAFHGIIIGVFVVIILLCIGFAFIALRCVQGTKTRDHSKVMPMMILLAFLTVGSIMQISSLTSTGIFSGLIDSVINGYFFVVIYSLYERFRREAENSSYRHNVHYKAAENV